MVEAGPYTEYLHDAQVITQEALANGGNVEDEHDAAYAVLDALLDAGWVLLGPKDYRHRIPIHVRTGLYEHFGDPFPSPWSP